MPSIRIEQFAGIAPRIHPTLLPDAMAQRAHNCVLKSGKLVPLRQPSKTSMPVRLVNDGMRGISEARSLFVWRHGSSRELLAWNGLTHVTRANVYDDKFSRLYVSGATGVGSAATNYSEPAVYFHDNGYLLTQPLCKERLPAPVATREKGFVSNAELAENENVRYTYFFQTWVDRWGYESGASEPSAEVTYYDGDSIVVGSVRAPENAIRRRIYKVVSGSENGVVQFVAEQESTSELFVAFTFRAKDDEAGEEIPNFTSPPTDLRWMTFVPGGFYTGFSETKPHEVRFSETGAPVSWPEAYGVSVEDAIVGLAVTLNNVFAITDGHPYSITGSSPDAMTASRIATEQGCVSARSICTLDGNVYYVSQDGICRLKDGASNVELLTGGWFSKREWGEFDLATARMVAYDNALFLWFGDSPVAGGLRVELQEGSSGVTTHDEFAYAATVDVATDRMYFVRGT